MVNKKLKEIKPKVIKKEVFICNICNSVYSDEKVADECNKKHYVIDKIEPIYATNDLKNQYPTYIKIELLNNNNQTTVIRYTRRDDS